MCTVYARKAHMHIIRSLALLTSELPILLGLLSSGQFAGFNKVTQNGVIGFLDHLNFLGLVSCKLLVNS
jgi:hypothetical protein